MLINYQSTLPHSDGNLHSPRIPSDARTKVVNQSASDYDVYDAREGEAEGEEPLQKYEIDAYVYTVEQDVRGTGK